MVAWTMSTSPLYLTSSEYKRNSTQGRLFLMTDDVSDIKANNKYKVLNMLAITLNDTDKFWLGAV